MTSIVLFLRKLIEKAQILAVHSFPFVNLIFAKIALTGIKYNKLMSVIASASCIFMFPVAILNNLYNTLAGKFVIGQVSISITTLCTLKCKECSTMMPLYKNPKNMDCMDIISDIDKLLDAVDCIYVFYVYGGEPFIHRDIAKIINKLLSSKKIKRVNIVTNGTIIPGKEATDIMKSKKLKVQISGYPQSVVPNVSVLIKYLKENNIYYVYNKSQKWKYLGDKKIIKRNPHEKREVFDLCYSTLCNTMIHGKFHICPVAAAGVDLGIFPERDNDFVNIRELSREDARKKLKELFSLRYISACDFCEGNTFLAKTIEVAEQI
jgi:organic radical activating enzyme